MPKKKKPVTTKKGQHHKFKSFMMNLVKDNDISKVDSNVLRKRKESFEKKKVTFEKRNADPAHFHDVIYHEFPSVIRKEFSLWRLPMNKYTLIPLPKNIDNAVALCNYEDLNRSVIYIRLMAAPDEAQDEVPGYSNFYGPDTNQDATSDDEEETEDDMDASVSTEQTMPEHIAQKRKHLSESEDRSQKRKSHGADMKYEDIPSSDAVLKEYDNEVASPITHRSYEASGSNQIQRFDSNGCSGYDPLNNLTYLDSLSPDLIQILNQLTQNNQEFDSLPTTGRQGINAALDEMQEEDPPGSSNFTEPETNQNVISGDDEETEEEMNTLVSTEETITEVQLNTTSNSNAGQHDMNSGDASIDVPKAEQVGAFYCNLCSVIGLAALDKRIYIICKNSDILRVHSSHKSFEKISDHKVNGLKMPFQIVASSKKNCLYIVDGEKSQPRTSGCIWKATDGDEFVAKYQMPFADCCCLSVTEEGDLVLLAALNYCLYLINADCNLCFRCIDLLKIDRKEFGNPHFVISSLDNAFYISSADDTTRISMVYKISGDGELLNAFGGRSGKGSGQLSSDCNHQLILDRYGRVIVLDNGNDQVLLLNSNLEFMTTLLSLSNYNYKICYDAEDRLFIEGVFGCIKAYSISQFESDRLMKIETQKPLKYDEGMNKTHVLGNISIKNEKTGQNSIRGVVVLLDKIYILTNSAISLWCCLHPFKWLFSMEYMAADFWDIAADECNNLCLYVTNKADNCVLFILLDLRRKKWLQNICSPYSLSVSKDGSVVIPNNREQSIDVYKGGKTAQLLLSIKLYPILNNSVELRHAIKVQEHYVVCHGSLREDFEDVNDDYVTNKVLLVSTNGDILRSFECLSTSIKLNLPNHLAVDREGGIIVADSKNKRVVRLNGKLEQEKILLCNETEGIDEPWRLSYDWKNDRLFVCHSQSLDIFSCSLDFQKRIIDPKLSPGIKSLNLPREFQNINQMDTKTIINCEDCVGGAILHERLYLLLINDEVASVRVHKSDPPFDLIDVIRIGQQSDLIHCYDMSIVTSSAHGRCYIRDKRKIWYLLNGSQKTETFLKNCYTIYSMSVTTDGQLLVVYPYYHLAIYNSEGECTECVFLNNYKGHLMNGVKTEDKFICITSDEDSDSLMSIYERSVDGSDCCFYGPFDFLRLYDCKAMTLGEDGQVLILSGKGVLSYDYKSHLLSIQLTEDDHKMSKVTGFCYSKEKKQLLICGHEGIAFLQMLQNKQIERSSERHESLGLQRKKNSSDDKNSCVLYSVRVHYDFHQVRGITRLGNNICILLSSELMFINSKDIRKKKYWPRSLKVPSHRSEPMKGDLRDIAASHVDLCLYVTDKRNRCVWSVTLYHFVSLWLDKIRSPYTLSVAEDGSVCILDNKHKILNVYNSNATKTKSIRLPPFMTCLRHAVQTSSGNFIICWNKKSMEENGDDDSEDDEENPKANEKSWDQFEAASEYLLWKISPEGNFIRTFSSTESTPSSQLLVQPLHLAIDPSGRTFVIEGNCRILLFDNQLRFIENISHERAFENVSLRLFYYDNCKKELLVICAPDGDCCLLMCIKI